MEKSSFNSQANPLEIPPEHGQADHPPSDDTASSAPDMLAYVEHPGYDSVSSEADSMYVELGGSESMGTSPTMNVCQSRHSLTLLETSLSEEHSSDDMLLARGSPILFMMSPGVNEQALPQEPTSPNLFSDEMPLARRSPMSAAPMSFMMPPPDTSDSQVSDSDVSILTEGYLADIESANEFEYTAEPELLQEEMLAICAAQRELNGNARLALFRIPPKKCGICPICKIGMPKNK